MKRLILAVCAGLMALAMASPSFAADLPRPAYKAPAYIAPFSWTGFYIGINGGYGWGSSHWTNTVPLDAKHNVDGAMAGGTIGYNWQTGNWVWGLEGDWDASWIKGSGIVAGGICATPGCETKNTWLATGRVRIGYAWDRWLPFLTGGAAYGNVKMKQTSGATDSDEQLGWTAGVGVEYAFYNQWSAKLEYLYVDLGKANCAAATCGTATDVKFTSNLVRLGLNYRF